MKRALDRSVAAGLTIAATGIVAVSPLPAALPDNALRNLEMLAAGSVAGLSDLFYEVLDPVPSTSWLDVATATVTNLSSLLQFVFSNPVPVLQQFITNLLDDPSQIFAHLADLFSAETISEVVHTLALVPVYPLNATAAALSSTAEAFLTALHDADFATLLKDLVNFPATITGAFLNGFPDPAWLTWTGIDPAGALLTNTTAGPDFGSLFNLLQVREIIAQALGADPALGDAAAFVVDALADAGP